MLNALRLQVSTTARLSCSSEKGSAVVFPRRQLTLRQSTCRHFASLRVQFTDAAAPEQSDFSHLTSAVRYPSAVVHTQWSLNHRHVQFLSYTACAAPSGNELWNVPSSKFLPFAAISATWLFCSAIPALLAFKRAAESLEKLMDTAREELPSTMAAVRLSGMEISYLTMELSDIGQEITQGVRSSTQAVRIAEERLRRLTNFTPTVSMREVTRNTDQTAQPVLARTARGLREGIAKGRGVLRMFFMLTQYSRTLLNFFRSRAKAR